jgi:Carboxypeptidase regulatory-like domain
MTHLLLTVLLAVQVSTLGQTGTIQGRILSADGIPAAGLRIAAQAVPDDSSANRSPNVMAAIAQTDSAGRYRLDAVPAGRYYITAGLVDSPTYYPGVVEIAEAKAVAVKGDAGLTGIDFTIPRLQALKISGRILLEGNQALAANQQVALVRPDFPTRPQGRLIQMVVPGADGSFEFTNVVPGTYRIGLSPLNGSQPQQIRVEDKDIHVEIRTGTLEVSGRLVIQEDTRTSGALPNLQLAFAIANPATPGAKPRLYSISVHDGAFTLPVSYGNSRVSVASMPAGLTVEAFTYGSADLLADELKINPSVKEELKVVLKSTTVAP